MLIVGAGAAAKDLLAMLMLETNAPRLVFYDDVTDPPPQELFGHPVLHDKAAARAHLHGTDPRFLVAVGGTHQRFTLSRRFRALGGTDGSMISRHAMVGAFNNISPSGVLIMHGSILTNGLLVGEGTFINMRCTLGHNLRVGSWCELAPGVTASESEIGDFSFMGIGSLLLPGVSLGRNVTVGVGAVVVHPVEDNWIVAGNPARKIGENPPPPDVESDERN